MTYVPKLKPWAHQEEALRRLEGQKAFALLMAMRTGKTKVTLDDFGRLEDGGECQDLLIIAPAGVYRTWAKAINDHVGASLHDRLKVHVWSAQASIKDSINLNHFLSILNSPRILIINVEALSFVDRARDLCIKFLSQRKAMCVVDESTTIKTHNSKRTKFILHTLAPLAMYRRILTGLVTPQSPLDVYSQFSFLDKNILRFSSYYAFRARYAVIQRMAYGGRSVPIVVGYRDIEELKDRIAPYSYRVTLEECYDLPPKIYQTREVELTPEQRRIYKEIKNYATSSLGKNSHVTATLVITQILRLHQVLCGHVTDETGAVHIIPEHRTRALLDLLEEQEGKSIVWCSYDADVRKVAEELTKAGYSVARFWGGNINEREEEERRFLNDPNCRVMVATAAAGGRGRTWTVADLVVYYSNTPNLEHRSQSEERAQGIDKTRSVLYVDLVAPGTVDERILKALKHKINMAATINGDNYREWLI